MSKTYEMRKTIHCLGRGTKYVVDLVKEQEILHIFGAPTEEMNGFSHFICFAHFIKVQLIVAI